MAIIILLLIFYVVPAIITYFGIRYQYKREWTTLSPGMTDLLLVILPLFNVGYAFFVIMDVGVSATVDMHDRINNEGGNKIRKFFAMKDDEEGAK